MPLRQHRDRGQLLVVVSSQVFRPQPMQPGRARNLTIMLRRALKQARE